MGRSRYVRTPFAHDKRRLYFLFTSRCAGAWSKVKSTISSPVPVLISWCRDRTWQPVTSSIIASKRGRTVSIRWVRTCLSRSLPFSAGSDSDEMLFSCGQNANQADYQQIADQVRGMSFGPRPI